MEHVADMEASSSCSPDPPWHVFQNFSGGSHCGLADPALWEEPEARPASNLTRARDAGLHVGSSSSLDTSQTSTQPHRARIIDVEELLGPSSSDESQPPFRPQANRLLQVRLRKKTNVSQGSVPIIKTIRRRLTVKSAPRASCWHHAMAASAFSRSALVVAALRMFGLKGHRELFEALSGITHRKVAFVARCPVSVRILRQRWARMQEAGRMDALAALLQKHASALAEERANAPIESPYDDLKGGMRWDPDMNVRGCMLTWNGAWLAGSAQVRSICTKELTIPATSELLQQTPDVQSLWGQFLAWWRTTAECKGIRYYSCQMELTPTALKDGRVHIHLYFHMSDDGRFRIGRQAFYSFACSLPHMVCIAESKKKNSRTAIPQGHYYCSAPKIGALFSFSTYHKNSDYVVQTKWIENLYRKDKMDDCSYERELLASKGRVCTILSEFKFRRERLRELEIEAESRRDLAKIEANFKQFVSIPMVHEWLSLFPSSSSADAEGRSRWPFLVLVGPSCYGKTAYGASLKPPCLVLNMQRSVEPDLRDYVRGEHNSILLDEVPWRSVLLNKSLFQCGPRKVKLAQSPCMLHVYNRYLYGVPLIVCTNSWTEDARIPEEAEDVAWLATNTVVVRVDRKLWRD